MGQSEKASWRRFKAEGEWSIQKCSGSSYKGWAGANFLGEGTMWAKAGSVNVWSV